MKQDEQDSVIVGMVRACRELRRKVVCITEKLEKAAEALQMAHGIADWAARRLENAQTPAFENVEYPTASELRAAVVELDAARQRIATIDSRLNDC